MSDCARRSQAATSVCRSLPNTVDRAVIVGNCQAGALEMMLRTNEEFTKRFELVSFPAVHRDDGGPRVVGDVCLQLRSTARPPARTST